MTRWNPGKQERLRILSGLDGHLDAIASMNGRYRDHMMNAQLIQKRGLTAEQALRRALSESGTRVVSISGPNHWTGIEYYFRREFLSKPFDTTPEAFDKTLSDTRHVLAFRCTDLVSFLAKDFEPGALFHVELGDPGIVRYTGCLIEYERDAVWITSRHRVRSLPAEA